VTVEVTGAGLAEVAGAVEVAGAEVAAATGDVTVGATGVAGAGLAGAAAAAVTADVTGATADVAEVTGAGTAGVDGGVVAACACRENASKRTRMPAATIATCTARKAMRRDISCGMSSSAPPGET
jgi:hypothetical protein